MEDDVASEMLMQADDDAGDPLDGGPFTQRDSSEVTEDSWFGFMEKVLLKAKHTLTGTLLLLSEEASTSSFATKIGVTIMCLQSVSYVLAPLTYGDISEEDKIRQFLSAIVFYANLKNLAIRAMTYRILLYVTICVIFFTLSISIFVGYRRLSGSNSSGTWSVKILRRTAAFLGGVAWMPLQEVLSYLILVDTSVEPSATSALRVIGGIFYAFLTFFVLVTVSTNYDPLLTSESTTACAHTRIAVLERIVMLCCSVGKTVSDVYDLWGDDLFDTLRMCAFLVSSGGLAFLYIMYQPFYRYKINVWYAVSNMILLWLNIGMIVRSLKSFILAQPKTVADFDAAVLIVFGGPLVIPLTSFLIHHRIQKLCHIDTFRIRNAYELELKMRLYLQDHHPALREGTDEDSVRNSSSMPTSDLDADNATVFEDSGLGHLWGGSNTKSSQAQLQHQLSDKDREERRVLRHVRHVYEAAVSQFSASPMVCMFQIHFFICFFSNERGTILSREPLLRARQRKPYYDLEFRLFKLSSRLRESLSTGRDVVSFVASEKCEREARLYDRISCVQLLEFWKEFQSKSQDMQRIQLLSKNVFESFAKAQSAYMNLIKLQPRSSRHLNAYGSFLTDILNDKASGSKITYRADALEEERLKGAARPGKQHDFIGERLDPVLIFEINDYASDDQSNFGEISYVNNDAAYLLNSVSHKLVGRNVKEFLVPPFSTHMQTIVRSFFKEGWSPFFGRAVRTFLVSSQQHLVETSMRLAPYTSDGVNFTIFVSLNPLENISDPPAQEERWYGYFLTSTSHDPGRVLGANMPCSQLLQRFTHIRESEVNLRATSITANDIVEDYADLRDDLIRAGDVWTEIDLVQLKEHWESRIASIGCQVRTYDYEGLQLDRVTIAVTLERPPRKSSPSAGYNLASPNSILSPGSLSSVVGTEHGDFLSNMGTSGGKLALGARGRFPSRALSSYAQSTAGGDKAGNKVGNRYSSGKSTSSTGTEEGAATAYLRKMLHEEMTRQHMSPMLQSLSTKYLATVCFVLLFSVIYFVIQENAFKQYAEELAFLNSAGYRRFTSVSLAYCVHALYLLNQGFTLPAGMTEENLRAELALQAGNLKTIEKESLHFRTKSDGIFEAYSMDNTELLELDLQDVVTSKQSLFEATSFLVSVANQLSRQNLSEFSLENPDVYVLMNQINGPDSYLQDLNRTTFEYMRLAEGRITQLVPIFVVAVVLALLLQMSLLLIFIAPLILMIERNKVEVLQVLRSIPPYSVGTITSKCKTRLQDYHDVSHEALTAQFGKPSQQESRSRRKKVRSSSAGKSSSESYRYKTATIRTRVVRWLSCGPCRSRIARWRHQGSTVVPIPLHHADRDRGSTGSMKTRSTGTKLGGHSVNMPWGILARLSLPGNMALVFYALNFQVGFFTKMDYFLHLPISVNLGGLRRATLRLLKHMVLMYLASTSFPQEPRFKVYDGNVTTVMNMFIDVNDGLFNGRGRSAGLLHYAADETDQVELILENGCHQWRQLEGKPTSADCEEFMLGVLRGGLSAASFQFLEGLKTVVTEYGTTGDVQTSFADESLGELLELEEYYLQNQFTTSVIIYVNGITSTLEAGKTHRNVILALFLILTTVLYVFVVRAVLRTLDQTLRRTRRLLLMVPEELFGRLPILKDFVQREFKKSRI